MEPLRVPSGRLLSEVDWNKVLSKCTPTQEDFDNLILEHFIVEGLGEAAECFCKEAGLPLPSDMHEINARFQIRKAIEAGDMPTATTLLNDLNPHLLDMNRRVHFYMLLQRMIELLRTDKLEEALVFGQDYLAPVVEENPDEFAPLMEQVMTLVLFPQTTAGTDILPDSLKTLYSQEQRAKTAQMVNLALLESFVQAPIESKLPNLLKLFSWSQQALGTNQPPPFQLENYFNLETRQQ